MKKWILSTILLILISIQVLGQIKIKGYEYWYDNNYTNRQQQSFNPQDTYELNLMADLSGLTDGLHHFSIRFQDTQGNWSSVESKTIYKLPISQNIKILGYEYWFDADTDNKKNELITATETFDHQGLIDVSHLPDGLHVLQIRYRDNYNNWSPIQWRFFLKQTKPSTPTLIQSYRYWINENPTVIHDVPISPPVSITEINRDLQIEGVPPGSHTLYIQFKDTRDNWSSVYGSNFEMVNCHPGKADIPQGLEVICQGLDKTNFITHGTTDADSYEWGIDPPEAGTLYPHIKEVTINWNLEYSGEVDVFVRANNTCGPGEFSDTLDVSIIPILDKPNTPEGLDKLCIKPENGTYTVTEIEYATSYNWILEPINAGTVISPVGDEINKAEISWKPDFTGTVELSVSGENKTCKDQTTNPISDTLTITINSPPEQPSVTASGPLSFCIGYEVTLETSLVDGLTYFWSNGSKENSITVSETGAYTLFVIDGNNCISSPSEAQQVKVYALPDKPIITQDATSLKSNYSVGNQWFYEGKIMNGETNSRLVTQTVGEYSVKYTDFQGCSSMSDIYFFKGLGIAKLSNGELIKVFPNPNHGEFNISLPNTVSKIPRIKIVSLSGKEIDAEFQYQSNMFKVNLSEKIIGQFYLIIEISKERHTIPFSVY